MCQAPEKRNFLRLPEVPPAAPTALWSHSTIYIYWIRALKRQRNYVNDEILPHIIMLRRRRSMFGSPKINWCSTLVNISIEHKMQINLHGNKRIQWSSVKNVSKQTLTHWMKLIWKSPMMICSLLRIRYLVTNCSVQQKGTGPQVEYYHSVSHYKLYLMSHLLLIRESV